MMKKISRFLLIILIIPLIIPINANAERMTFGQVLDDLSKAQADLNNNNNSINNKKNQVTLDSSTIKRLKNEIEEMTAETKKLEEEILESEKDIADKKEKTKSVISYLQMSQGENAYLEYVFGTDSITDLVYRLAVVEQITEYNAQIIDELQDLIKKNEDKKKELASKQKEHETRIENLNKEIAKLNSSISALGDLGPGLEQEVKTKQELVNYYKEQGCKNRGDIIGVDCAVTSNNAYFSRPLKQGYITSFIGYRWGSLHRGLDMGSSTGRNTPLYSIGNGVITSIWRDSSGAQCVNVEYRDRNGTYYTAIYAHLSRYGNIYKGQKVDSNTIIGYMGDTGYAFGVHLHLELWPCRLYIDSQCSTWNRYVSFVSKKYNEGFKGAESVISFPSRTYQTWYTK